MWASSSQSIFGDSRCRLVPHFRSQRHERSAAVTRHYLPGMLKKNWGRIVFISSESAVQIPAEMGHYGMSKTAQIAGARVSVSVAGSGVM